MKYQNKYKKQYKYKPALHKVLSIMCPAVCRLLVQRISLFWLILMSVAICFAIKCDDSKCSSACCVGGHKVRHTASVRIRTVEGCDTTVTHFSSHRPAVVSNLWPWLLVVLRCDLGMPFCVLKRVREIVGNDLEKKRGETSELHS